MLSPTGRRWIQNEIEAFPWGGFKIFDDMTKNEVLSQAATHIISEGGSLQSRASEDGCSG